MLLKSLSWRVEEVPKDAVTPWRLNIYAPEKQDEPVMVVFVTELNQLYSLQEYWEDVVKPTTNNELKSVIFDNSNPELIKLKLDNNKEHSANKLNYTFEENNQLMKATEVITVYNYRGYNILFKVPNSEHKKYERFALQVIDSFEFTVP